MSARSPENLVNVSAIAFLLDMKTHVEPMGEYILVKKLENGVMILLMDTPSHSAVKSLINTRKVSHPSQDPCAIAPVSVVQSDVFANNYSLLEEGAEPTDKDIM